MIHDQSRLRLAATVEYYDPVTGRLLRPRYIDIRDRVTATATDDKVITPTDAQQWSHLGLKYLEDARNWWVIADLSEVVDPFEDIVSSAEEAPVQLRVPSLERYLFRIITGEET